VLGFDTDATNIAQLRRRESYIGHIPLGTISALVDRGFEATGCFDRLGEVDAILICVPWTGLRWLGGPTATSLLIDDCYQIGE
jgi:UDP-N-acetyl-D-mannosaminuronate dehydrogenase